MSSSDDTQGRRRRHQHEPARDERGTPREVQEKVIRRTARKESWLEMLRRKRREAKGKPKRRSWVNRLWTDD